MRTFSNMELYVLWAWIIMLIFEEKTVTYSVDIKTELINLNGNGSVADVAELPKCKTGQQINLSSYKYLKEVCHSGSKCPDTGEKISSEAELLLHEKCSLMDSCANINFPSKDLRDQGIKQVRVQYKCLDKFDLSHGICSNATLSTDQTIHLLYHDPSSSYSECQCSVTSSSQFSVSLNDVRLRSETVTRKQCSPSTLQVHTKQYVCDDEKADYGSVFNKKWPDLMSMVSVVLDTNSSEFLPEMVWLIIEPKESVTVRCVTKPWKANIELTIQLLIRNSSMHYLSGDNNKPTSYSTHIAVGSCIIAAVAFLCIIAFILCRRQRRRRKSELTIRTTPHEQMALASDDCLSTEWSCAGTNACNSQSKDDSRSEHYNATQPLRPKQKPANRGKHAGEEDTNLGTTKCTGGTCLNYDIPKDHVYVKLMKSQESTTVGASNDVHYDTKYTDRQQHLEDTRDKHLKKPESNPGFLHKLFRKRSSSIYSYAAVETQIGSSPDVIAGHSPGNQTIKGNWPNAMQIGAGCITEVSHSAEGYENSNVKLAEQSKTTQSSCASNDRYDVIDFDRKVETTSPDYDHVSKRKSSNLALWLHKHFSNKHNPTKSPNEGNQNTEKTTSNDADPEYVALKQGHDGVGTKFTHHKNIPHKSSCDDKQYDRTNFDKKMAVNNPNYDHVHH